MRAGTDILVIKILAELRDRNIHDFLAGLPSGVGPVSATARDVSPHTFFAAVHSRKAHGTSLS